MMIPYRVVQLLFDIQHGNKREVVFEIHRAIEVIHRQLQCRVYYFLNSINSTQVTTLKKLLSFVTYTER